MTTHAPVPKRDRDRWATHASAYDGGTRCGATDGMMGGVVTCPDCLAILLPAPRVIPPEVGQADE